MLAIDTKNKLKKESDCKSTAGRKKRESDFRTSFRNR